MKPPTFFLLLIVHHITNCSLLLHSFFQLIAFRLPPHRTPVAKSWHSNYQLFPVLNDGNIIWVLTCTQKCKPIFTWCIGSGVPTLHLTRIVLVFFKCNPQTQAKSPLIFTNKKLMPAYKYCCQQVLCQLQSRNICTEFQCLFNLLTVLIAFFQAIQFCLEH